MKKSITALFTFLLLASPAWAGDPMTKLARGVGNIATSPLEYANQFGAGLSSGNPLVPIFRSVGYGTVMTVARILGGAYEVVTFPIPVPQNYDPLMNPPTAIETYQQLQ